jgi:hypothetical protein
LIEIFTLIKLIFKISLSNLILLGLLLS